MGTHTLETALAVNEQSVQTTAQNTMLDKLINQVKDLTHENHRLNSLLRSTESEKVCLFTILEMLPPQSMPAKAGPLGMLLCRACRGCLECWQTAAAAIPAEAASAEASQEAKAVPVSLGGCSSASCQTM